MEEKEMLSGVHDGHRDRVKQKFIENGFKGFNDHEILEMLLFYSVPRRDTNPLAHKLIDSFGSLSAVFDAPMDTLIECGATENSAVLIKTLAALSRAYLMDKYYNSAKIYTRDFLRQKLMTSFMGLTEERVLLVLFDVKGFELFYGFISEGSFSMSELNSRKIIELAMKYKASAAVIAHNHPSGVARPSPSDIESTIFLKKSLKSIDVSLLDHFIISDAASMSFTQDERYMEIFL